MTLANKLSESVFEIRDWYLFIIELVFFIIDFFLDSNDFR